MTTIDIHEDKLYPDQYGCLIALINTTVLSPIALPVAGRITGICSTSSGTDAVNKKSEVSV